eukprot:GHVS01050667.1.p1 GENE.GHVS01050667.1~~GHVS01050667.1.p1  ORF type:complete len:122 (+),score=3.74 GHVS01050667.1:30-395(+)
MAGPKPVFKTGSNWYIVFMIALMTGDGNFNNYDGKSFLAKVTDDGMLQLTLREKGKDAIILNGWNIEWSDGKESEVPDRFSMLLLLNPRTPDDPESNRAIIFEKFYGENNEFTEVGFFTWQ